MANIMEVDSRQVPHGSELDFQAIPVQSQPTSSLTQWLAFRGVVFPTSGGTRRQIVSLVESALRLSKAGTPLPIKEAEQTGGKYTSIEQLTSDNVQWDGNADALLRMCREQVKSVDNDHIDRSFGDGGHGVRRRALRQIVDGNLDPSSISVASAKLKSTKESANIIRLKCTPSMNSQVHSVYLVFNRDGECMSGPSMCDCPHGRWFCSHLLCGLLFIRVVQTQSDWSLPTIIGRLPEPIKSIQGLPIATELAFQSEQSRADKPPSDKPRVSDVTRALKAIWSWDSSESVESDDDDDDDDDEDDEDDDDDDDEDDEDEMSGWEDEDEYDWDDACTIDRSVNDVIAEAKATVDNVEKVNVCSLLDGAVASWEGRERKSGKAAVRRARPIHKIHEYNHKLVHGPRSEADALRQAERLMRLHVCYEEKKLAPTLLSEYIKHPSIQDMLAGVLETNNSPWMVGSPAYNVLGITSVVGDAATPPLPPNHGVPHTSVPPRQPRSTRRTSREERRSSRRLAKRNWSKVVQDENTDQEQEQDRDEEYDALQVHLRDACDEVERLKRQVAASELRTLQLEERVAEEELKLRRAREQGFSRRNMSDAAWHKDHPEMTKQMIGFDSWDETVTYMWALWPELEPPVWAYTEEENDKPLSDFEKCLLAKIWMSGGDTEYVMTLSFMTDLECATIEECIDEWMPKWGEAGKHLSVLSLTEAYLQAVCPSNSNKEQNYGRIGAVMVGKDFRIRTPRDNPAITRACWSDRLKASVVRCIAWITPQGLSFEHTDLLLAGVSVKALVELWAPRLGHLPAGWAMLSDQDFAGTSRMYPNFNAQLTPRLLAGRAQCTVEEIQSDLRIDQLRNTCQEAFARVTNEAALKEVIDNSYFVHLNSIHHWGHANANLMKSLQK